MPELIVPTTRLHNAWLDSHREWAGEREDGAGLSNADDTLSPEGFRRWVDRLRRSENHSYPADPGWVHTSVRWIVEDDRMLGAIALRHEINDFLLTIGGHIGYGIRPSARRHGLATFALARTLAKRASSAWIGY